MTITWGANTVHTFGGTPAPGAPAPNSSLFGGSTPAPSTLSPAAPSFSFGGSTAAPVPAGSNLFGSTPPASSGGNVFGSSPSPAGGGSFGITPAPAGGSLFGSAPAGGSLFGGALAGGSLFGGAPASGSSLFGGAPSSGTSIFGGPSQPQQQQQIPAQAALQGYIDASTRQEAERVRAKLEQLFLAYNGQEAVAEHSLESAKFVAITYNPLTPEEEQIQNVARQGFHQIFEPQRPPQICGRDWTSAVVSNPYPDKYKPIPLIGAASLQARVSWQQEQAREIDGNIKRIRDNLDFVRQRESQTRQDLIEKERKFVALRLRLLQVMTKVEIARSLNKPFQLDEYQSSQRLKTLHTHVDQLRNDASVLQDQAIAHSRAKRIEADALLDGISIPELEKVLKKHDEQLQKLIETVKKDRRDVDLVGSRVLRM